MGQGRVRIVRLGLVGVGAWGRRYADAAARRAGQCEVVAYSRARERPEDFLRGAVGYPHWTALLERGVSGDLDGVIVATTPENQAEVAEAAIRSGVPLLVEKPIGLSPATAARVWTTFQASARPPLVLVDYIHLWSSAYRALRARIASQAGGIASVASIETVGGNRGPFRGWSPLYDYASHDLSMCLDLLGVDAPFQLENVRRSASGDPSGEVVEALFRLGDVPVRMRVGNGLSEKARLFAVTLRDGRRLVYDDLQPHPLKLTEQQQPVPVDTISPLDAILGDFIQLLREGSRGGSFVSGTGLKLALRIAQLLDAVDGPANKPA